MLQTSEEADYIFALEMQKRLDAELADNGSDDDINEVKDVGFKSPTPVSKYRSNLDEDYLNRTQNLVHPQWETLDPTPDIFSMFARFDGKFFQNRLKCVTLEWSKRMYSCAGICYQRRNKFGMAITIRLSEPLLKLRTRKDLIQTLLHEMIHAYCFVLNIREGNGGHGPNFKKIMCAINKVAGTNITVYHTFHDEVNVYRQHWWRCNGVCQEHSPFFGYVKRSSNRAPGINDQWWEHHIRSCGGMFMKIKGPDKKPKPEKPAKVNKPTQSSTTLKAESGATDLRKYFSPTAKTSTTLPKHQAGVHGEDKKHGSNPKDKPSNNKKPEKTTTPAAGIAAAFPPTSYPGLSTDPINLSGSKHAHLGGRRNLGNIMSLRDLENADTAGGVGSAGRALSSPSSHTSMSGRGYTLNKNHNNQNLNKSAESGAVDHSHLRRVWSKRFENSEKSKADENQQTHTAVPNKRRRISNTPEREIDFVTNENSSEDDDVQIIANDASPVIEILSDSDDDAVSVAPVPLTQKRKETLTTAERQQAIKQEILDETDDLCDEDIILIDDDYDDNSNDNDLTDTSIIDEFFGEDTLLAEFQCENDGPSGSRYFKNELNDIITCPICMEKMKRSVLEEHLNGCMGIVIKLSPPKRLPRKTREAVPRRKRPSKPAAKELLRRAGYTEQELTSLSSSNTMSNSANAENAAMPIETERHRRQRNFYSTKRQCPGCGEEFDKKELLDHVDECSGEIGD